MVSPPMVGGRWRRVQMSDPQSQVILVAVHVDGTGEGTVVTPERAQTMIIDLLTLDNIAGEHQFVNGDKAEVSWWIAEDKREDGSDNQSAVFVPPHLSQAEARDILAGRAHFGPMNEEG